jgi:hypothetical protein
MTFFDLVEHFILKKHNFAIPKYFCHPAQLTKTNEHVSAVFMEMYRVASFQKSRHGGREALAKRKSLCSSKRDTCGK